MPFIKNFIADEAGASAAEYALILAIVGVAISGTTLLLANQISSAITGTAGSTTGEATCGTPNSTGRCGSGCC